jgi:hypothetical protein
VEFDDQAQGRAGIPRPVIVGALTVLLVAFAAVITFAVVPASNDPVTPPPASAAPPPATGASTSRAAPDLAAKEELTLDAAKEVWALNAAAKDSRDVASFTRSTCKKFIDADMELRGITDVPTLLDTYKKAEKFLLVQTIANPVVIAAQGQAPADGTIEVSATVTDNRQVPATPKQRTLTYQMVWEQKRWKLCPTTDLV